MTLIEEIKEKEHELARQDCKNAWNKMLKIEEKSSCWRVQMLDKFADFLEKSAIKVRAYTMTIHTPCLIKTKKSSINNTINNKWSLFKIKSTVNRKGV